jgi:hypothetical protein
MRDRDDPEKPAEGRKTPDRSERLAAALRANLARRKAQKRAREADAQESNEQG